MGTQGVHIKGVLPWVGSLGSSCRYKRFFSCIGCSSRPNTKYPFLTILYFTSFFAIAHQAGHAVVPHHLSLSMCLCRKLSISLPLWLRSGQTYYATQKYNIFARKHGGQGMGGGMGATVCAPRQGPHHLGLRPMLVLCIIFHFCNEKMRFLLFEIFICSRTCISCFLHARGKCVPETDGKYGAGNNR
jgi:hypothetical protein